MPDTPAASASAPKPTTRGRGAPRPRGGIQRKSKAEREQFAKEEAERQKARAAEHEASTRGARAGSRAVNRGRGGGATPGQRQGPAAGSGGVFGGGGGGITTTQSRHKYEGYAELLEGGVNRRGPEDGLPGDGDAGGAAGASKRSGGAGAGGSRGGGGGGGGGARAPTAGETVETTTDDERDDGPKRDIERIWISSDEDEHEHEHEADDAVMSSSGKGKQKVTATNGASKSSRYRAGLRPVRAPRMQRDEEDQTGRDRSGVGRKRPPPSKKPDVGPQEISSDEHRERDGDGDGGVEMDMDMDMGMDIDRDDSVHFIKEQPSSPDLRKRALKKQPGGVPHRHHGPLKAFANETLEDRAERLRMQDDVDKLHHIFVPRNDNSTNGDVDHEPSNLHDGKLLLFQLPPLTPFLIDPGAFADSEPKFKTEPSTATNGTVDLDTLPDAAPPTTETDGPVKQDPDRNVLEDKSASRNKNQDQLLPGADGLLTATAPLEGRLPAGVVGKLQVHRSGKVTLDWGGTDMEVKLGSEVDFLQDVVLVERGGSNGDGDVAQDDEHEHADSGGAGGAAGGGKKDKDTKGAGKAYALGHVRHKMILIPDWAKLYD
ncbi:hypothetical protein A1O7_08561 [Cladophialophora yegresii CBS 114405]|uniref:DNA-directed RNA polymerase III subunit RPC4 n=1 Tax=Cladophialophora yegresii CBS 114405 TaxID=1182544 RepID=W9VIW9_9EURO|nr:uncharacterized protein A1O7_08561 [Cladophialophora yegresii CBS 114405]EXJ55632.1 hypothetical protein A1O7_08561 [Cladophialophora yegresii CBS 114405]